MMELSAQYAQVIDEIKQKIQSSEILNTYLDSEEEEDYKTLITAFEPALFELHQRVATEQPLQLVSLEKALLQAELEGLLLPRILGFSVLRGELNDSIKYVRPQEHFKQILQTICTSSNFDYVKNRIGQSVQLGLSLSSDIWVTNLINQFDMKNTRYYLQSMKNPTYRTRENREAILMRYRKQFAEFNYFTTEFPSTVVGLESGFHSLKSFLLYRIKNNLSIDSYKDALIAFIGNDQLSHKDEHLYILGLVANFIVLEPIDGQRLENVLNKARKEQDGYDERYLFFLLDQPNNELYLGKDEDMRMINYVDNEIDDDLSAYYKLMTNVHSKGYHHGEIQQEIEQFYNAHEGLSTINKGVRYAVLHYVARFLKNLSVDEYQEFMELTKIYAPYINSFNNQKFNQYLKNITMRYLKRLLKRYTDKRGKDYQDIKKYVRAMFMDLGFMTDKQLVELFKTPRKKKVVASK